MAACHTDCWWFLSQHVSGCHTCTLNTQMHMSKRSGGRSVSCAILHEVPCSTRRTMGLETPNLTSSSIDQLIPLQSRAPDTPISSHHPHSFPFLILYTHFALEARRWAQRRGEGRQRGFLPGLYHRGSPEDLSGKYLVKMKCICGGGKHCIKPSPYEDICSLDHPVLVCFTESTH